MMLPSGILQLWSLLHRSWSHSSLLAAVCPPHGYPDWRSPFVSEQTSGLSEELENKTLPAGGVEDRSLAYRLPLIARYAMYLNVS